MTALPEPVARRLEELCCRHDVPRAGRAALERFLLLLAEDPRAPTTVREPGQAVDRHVADSLSGLVVPELDGASVVADLGSGAGAPALVVAAARPGLRVFAVESATRKCEFLRAAADHMGLLNVEVVCGRVEEWRAGLGLCDAVTARALAPLSVVVEYAAPLLAVGGAVVAWKAAPDFGETADGEAAARLLGLSRARVVSLGPESWAAKRSLYVYLRVGSLPNGYPRRPGMARKRPIRALAGD